MRAVIVGLALEIKALHLQIGSRPEQRVVQAFAPYGTDQPFNTWMREGAFQKKAPLRIRQDVEIAIKNKPRSRVSDI